MKHAILLVVTLIMTITLQSSYSIALQDQKNNPLILVVDQKLDQVTIKFSKHLTEEQGVLIITDNNGNVLLEEEVEVLENQVFKTIKLSQLSNKGAEEIIVTLKTQEVIFTSSYSL